MDKLMDKIVEAVEDARKEVADFVSGNKSAGTRARKCFQDIRALAKDGRKKVLELRKASKAAAKKQTKKTTVKKSK